MEQRLYFQNFVYFYSLIRLKSVLDGVAAIKRLSTHFLCCFVK